MQFGKARRASLPALLAVMLAAAGCEQVPYPSGTTTPAPQASPQAQGADPVAAQPASRAVPVERPAPSVEPVSEALSPIVDEGSDRFARPVVSSPSPSSSLEGELQLSFEDAELRDVVQVILGEFLGADFILDPRIGGTVNLQSSEPLPADVLLQTLETLLRSNGAAMIQDGSLYRIVPVEEARRASVVPQLGNSKDPIRPGYAIRVVPLRHIGAQNMAELLEPFMPGEGILRSDPDRNLLVLAGTSREVENLVDTVATFDVDWLEGMSIGLYPLENVGAETMAEELEVIFDSAEGPLTGLLRLVPIRRLNAILVVTQRRDLLAKTKDWIDQLDRNVEAGRNLYVYFVQNGKAADLAALLSEVFSGNQTDDGFRISGDLAPGRASIELASSDGAASGPEDTTEPGQEASANGTGEAATTDDGARNRESESLRFSEEADIRVIADEVNNALLILANKQDYRMVEATLLKLDIVPLQVLIEATIAEVTLTEEMRFGVQWFFQTGDLGLADVGRGTLSSGAASSLLSTFPGFSFILTESSTTRLVLDTLEDRTAVDVVSSPHLMVLDNQTAELQVGDEVPIVTQQARSVTDNDTPLVNTVQFRDTGVILRVTPRVSSGGLITMEIEQEVSDVAATTTSGIDSPTITQRRVKSSVVVRSGETIVLGGLIDDEVSRTESGIPYLSDIPVVGSLFGREEDRTERTELIVLISPRVVRNEEDARAATEELRERMKSIQLDRIDKPELERTSAPSSDGLVPE